jgi:hypothetical protein
MEKGLSIVLVDKRPYRKIAQDNWGLTNEQMAGMHVHHRVNAHEGGTNDPSNLFVCSSWFHANVWHSRFTLVEHARQAGIRSWKGLSKEESSRRHSLAAKSQWEALTPNQRKEKAGRAGRIRGEQMKQPLWGIDENGAEHLFSSLNEASFASGASRPNISHCCAGKRKKASGWTWGYLNKDLVHILDRYDD